MRRLLLIAFLTLLVLPASASAKPVLGMGEQLPQLLANPLFTDLGIKQVRVTVTWESLSKPDRLALLDSRMAQYQAQGLEPLVVFSRSYDPQLANVLPSLPEYTQMFQAFRARYPWVRQFVTWNEVNLYSQPSAKNPARVAQFYKTIKANCPGCTVLAAAMLDTSTMLPYAKRLKRMLKGQGRLIWGLHNYSDAMRASDKNTRAFIRAVKADVWIIETGCLVRYTGKAPSLRKKKFSERLQARAYKFITGPLIKRNPRVKRVYVYQWQAGSGATWDSGVLRPSGKPRPSYFELKRAVKAKRFKVG